MLALAQHPAQLFGMFPQKGALQVGADADIVIFDPDHTWRITAENQYQRVDYTPYEGMEMAGCTDTVLLSGQVAVEGGKVVAEGLGRYRPPGSQPVLALRVGGVLLASRPGQAVRLQ